MGQFVGVPSIRVAFEVELTAQAFGTRNSPS